MSWLYGTKRKMNAGYLEIKKKNGGEGVINIQQWLKGMGDGRKGRPMDGGRC